MPPKKVVEKLLGRLMAAWRDCFPYDPSTTDISALMFYSSRNNQFGLSACWKLEFKELSAECSTQLDQYPLEEFERYLQVGVADATEAAEKPTQTSAFFRKRIEEFYKKLDSAPEWETIIGITGLAANQDPFCLGPCRFFIMGADELFRWEQRHRSGRYDPPSDTLPFPDRLGLRHQIVGNWVASLRVRAVDCQHAMAKAKYRLEEALITSSVMGQLFTLARRNTMFAPV